MKYTTHGHPMPSTPKDFPNAPNISPQCQGIYTCLQCIAETRANFIVDNPNYKAFWDAQVLPEVVRVEEVDYCEVGFKGDAPWCETHDLAATHCSPNGDENVCEKYANANGCSCCEKNYDRGDKNLTLYKAAWDLLTPEQQAILRAVIEKE